MFLSELVMQAIHADRVREVERQNRQRRLLEPVDEAPATKPVDEATWLASAATSRGDRTRIPA